MSVREDIAGLLHEFRMGTYNTENLNMAEIDLWKADKILSHPRIAILAEDQSSMREPPTCPQCQAILHRVRRGADSPLNADQFDAVKAGDWYCSVCAGAEAKHTTYKYWWEKDLDMPPDPIFKRIEVKSE